MKLHLMSDLHFEHMPDYGASFLDALDPDGADGVILAGDILSLAVPRHTEFVLRRFRELYGSVLYVPGNHEFYKTSVGGGEALLEELEARIDGFTVLQAGRVVERGGVRFLGGTMWFGRHPRDMVFKVALNDFALIDGFTPWVWEQNRSFVEFLRGELREDDVVVTHHLPSARSTPPRFAGSPINMFFVCDQEQLIHERKPRAWLHGHTHRPVDYRLGATHVRSNPKGYPGERPAHIPYAPVVVEL